MTTAVRASSGAGLSLAGRHIGITADRRWRVQADLLGNLGARVVHGPALQTVDLSRDESLRLVTEALVTAPPEVLVASTGMGIGLWFEAADSWDLGDSLRAALEGSRIVARGGKAWSAVRRQGLPVAWQAPSETMDEVVAFLAGEGVASARVALQLFDPAGHPSTAALTALCRELIEVPVYRWLRPDDPGPAVRLVEQACSGVLDAVTFTSQPALHHLFRIAEDIGAAAQLRSALNTSVLPVCIGPVCGEAARDEGLSRPVWPEPPRLPAMVRLLAAQLGPIVPGSAERS